MNRDPVQRAQYPYHYLVTMIIFICFLNLGTKHHQILEIEEIQFRVVV